MESKEVILKNIISRIYSSWGFHTELKTFQNGSNSKSPVHATHKSGKELFIEILKKPCKKKERELKEFYDGELYKIIYLSDFSDDLKSLIKKLKQTLRANPAI